MKIIKKTKQVCSICQNSITSNYTPALCLKCKSLVNINTGEIIWKKEEIIPLVKGSIRKWSLIAVGLEADRGIKNCSLCKSYNSVNVIEGTECYVCPVYTFTGQRFCKNTPYSKWMNHHRKKHNVFLRGKKIYCDCGKCREIANEELMFLQNILEKIK